MGVTLFKHERMMAMKRWKRTAALLLSIVVLLCLCACGDQTSSESPDLQNTQQNDPASSETPDIPDPTGTEDSAETDETGGESAPPAGIGSAQTLALQKQEYGLYEGDDDELLV